MLDASRTAHENEGKKKALVIAISDYDRFPALGFCKNDGNRIYEVLKAQGYEITEDSFLLGRVKYEEMREAVRKFFKGSDVGPRDTLLFYFSGHGHLDDKGYHFLVTSEMDPKEPDDKGYYFEDLTRMMDRSDSLRKVMILDCCHAGGLKIRDRGGDEEEKGEEEVAKLGRKAISEALEKTIRIGQGTCILASSLGIQQSFKMPGMDYSAFSYYVIEGLEGKAINDDGHVTPEVLRTYITERLAGLPDFRRQTPISKLEIVGNLVLAEYPRLARRTTPTLPSEPPARQEDELLNLALSYAPINYQYVSLKNDDYQTKLDLLCAVNFGCYGASYSRQDCWNTRMARKRLREADFPGLTPVAYYSIAITETHYFLLYAFYHADTETHPNDLNGCMVILEKTDTKPLLLGMITIGAQDFMPYTFGSRLIVKSRPAWQRHFGMDVEETLGGDHPLTQQGRGHHAMYGLDPDNRVATGFKAMKALWSKREDIIMYRPATIASTYTRSGLYKAKNWLYRPTFNYELVDILDPKNGLYNRYLEAKNNGGNETFREDGSFHNDETVGNATGPWLWKQGVMVGGEVTGDMWEDPATLAASIFETTSKPFSTKYLKKMMDKK